MCSCRACSSNPTTAPPLPCETHPAQRSSITPMGKPYGKGPHSTLSNTHYWYEVGMLRVYRRTAGRFRLKRYSLKATFRTLRYTILHIHVTAATVSSVYLVLYLWSITYNKKKNQPGKVANPARGQLNKKNELFCFLSPFAPENLVSRAILSRVSLLISILRLNLVLILTGIL